MRDTFSREGRAVIERAHAIARSTGRRTVTETDLLLALSQTHDSTVQGALERFGVTADALLRAGDEPAQTAPEPGEPPLSPSAAEVIRLAEQMTEPGSRAASEHLLLALLSQGENGAWKLLEAVHVDPRALRMELKKHIWPWAFQTGRGRVLVRRSRRLS